ncbi:MAG: YeeE/YedE family protein [Anaerolineae bacterium]|nr:YeeE/YedE family protein [Anaerolineae bacterium]
MADTSVGGGSLQGAAPPAIVLTQGAVLRGGIACALLIGLAVAAYLLHITPDRGASASFSLLVGAALGVAFQRGRFCFFCIIRDYIEFKNSGPLFAILAALAVGGIGYTVVFGAFLPNSLTGRLPPQAHIGPVSWVLLAAGIAFGIGMALSGACISGHLYRLGEGYTRAPIALGGSLVGFGIGFFTWQSVYLNTLSQAPVAWLPATFGYSLSLILHLLALAVIGLVLLRRLPDLAGSEGGKLTLERLWKAVFVRRWNPLLTGALVGMIGVFAYFRVEPLGVTAQLGSIARTTLDNAGLLSERLNGLDTFAGCATVVIQTISDNGFLIGALVLASLSMALLGNHFKLSPRLTLRNSTTALLGGVLMGWGSMTALGCTVGTLLSGISAFAISGWVFGAAVFVGVWLGIKLKLHQS